ncbi:MAG: Type pilin PilA [Myxococcaceae bacterium]|nr:Type pilin PilA [Myxococcaceae bacterium]
MTKAPAQSPLPLVAVICSGVGLMFPPLLIVGLGLGIVALKRKQGSQVQAVLAVAIPLLAAMIFGILAVTALPKYRAALAQRKAAEQQARQAVAGMQAEAERLSQQAECPAALKQAWAAERAWFAEHDGYEEHPARLGFLPPPANRYLYLFAASGPVPPRHGAPAADDTGIGPDPQHGPPEPLLAALPAQVRSGLGVHGRCPECEITILCAANLDADPTLDVWTISTAARPGVAAGEPHPESDDLSP